MILLNTSNTVRDVRGDCGNEQGDWLPEPEAVAMFPLDLPPATVVLATTPTTIPMPPAPRPRKPRRPKNAPTTTEYTILRDSAEKAPWFFEGMRTNADEGSRPLIVKNEWRSLGISMGDYTLAEAADIDPRTGEPTERKWRFSIERKSLDDLFGTILSERDRFKRELASLNRMEFATVIVEANWCDIATYVARRWEIDGVPEHKRNARRKSVMCSIVAWQMPDRFPGVRWIFGGTKRGAEVTAWLLMDRYWRKVLKVEREKEKERAN